MEPPAPPPAPGATEILPKLLEAKAMPPEPLFIKVTLPPPPPAVGPPLALIAPT